MSFELVEARMRSMAEGVLELLPKGWGFLLIVTKFFDVGEKGKNTNYIANVDREDSIKLLEDLLHRFQNPEITDEERITSLLESLPQEDRMRVIRNFCASCGVKQTNPPCRCWDDS